jgi:hypothetical protein
MHDPSSGSEKSPLPGWREVFKFHVAEFVRIDQLGTVVRALGYDLTDAELQQDLRPNRPDSGAGLGQFMSLLAMARSDLVNAGRTRGANPCVQSNSWSPGAYPKQR